jgi:ABC-type Mn2+/Zn2+ transport system permease subunit
MERSHALGGVVLGLVGAFEFNVPPGPAIVGVLVTMFAAARLASR